MSLVKVRYVTKVWLKKVQDVASSKIIFLGLSSSKGKFNENTCV